MAERSKNAIKRILKKTIYGRIVALLYSVINHVIGVCGFESHRPYKMKPYGVKVSIGSASGGSPPPETTIWSLWPSGLGASLWHLFTQVRSLSNSPKWSVDFRLPSSRLGIA